MKVIFDFDDVIFNAQAFKEIFFRVLERGGYENIREKYETLRKEATPFSLYSFIRQVTVESSEENVNALYTEVMSSCNTLINHEVASIIGRLGKENCYIVTNGDEPFQMDKIERSIGLGAVRQIIVVSGSKAEIIAMLCKRHKDETVIFVDDKLAFINDIPVSDCQNLKTVLFNKHGLENLEAEINDSYHEEMKQGKRDKEVVGILKPVDHNQSQTPSFGMH